MFFARESELHSFNRLYTSGRFEFAVIYGRRRIGKTTLMAHFSEGKDVFFFSAQLTNGHLSLLQFSKAVLEFFSEPMIRRFDDWEMAFKYIGAKTSSRRLLFIIDEFPYLAESNPDILSVLQHAIDHQWKDGQLFLMLCGSTMGFMEREVLGAKSPIFGRRTAQFFIESFDYLDACKFYPNYAVENKLMAYAIWGGTPHYLHLIDDTKSIGENVLNTILKREAYLADEPTLLLKQEFREPGLYAAILEAISSGASKINEIATRIGEDISKCSKYLQSLMHVGLVQRETPFGAKESSRKSIYRVTDPFFRFWYRFVFSNKGLIDREMGEVVWEMMIEPYFSAFMGSLFEAICSDFLWHANRTQSLPFLFDRLGRWWGTDSRTKKEVEIDLVAAGMNHVLISECKWTKEPCGISILRDLENKAGCITGYEYRHFSLFSKSGFTKELIKEAASRDDLRLFNLEDLFV